MKTNNFFANVEIVPASEMESVKGGKTVIIKPDGTVIIID
jgi:hypothetical protein